MTHRVVGVEKTNGAVSFRTKGDANEDADMETVSASSVAGKYVFRVPLAGYVVSFARTAHGLVALIIIPGCLIIAGEVRKILKSLRDKHEA